MDAAAFIIGMVILSLNATNRDTYDKIEFDDVRNNAILTAIRIYMGREDPAKTYREKSVLLPNERMGEPGVWPGKRAPARKGGIN